jgi:hypothetical protein
MQITAKSRENRSQQYLATNLGEHPPVTPSKSNPVGEVAPKRRAMGEKMKRRAMWKR